MIEKLKRKRELEAEISRAVIRFEREFLGRGPLEIRVYLLDDMVLVRLRGVLTVAEQKLALAEARGSQLVKQMRQELIVRGQSELTQMVAAILGVAVRSVHTDISVERDERVIVLSLEKVPLPLEPSKEPRRGRPVPLAVGEGLEDGE